MVKSLILAAGLSTGQALGVLGGACATLQDSRAQQQKVYFPAQPDALPRAQAEMICEGRREQAELEHCALQRLKNRWKRCDEIEARRYGIRQYDACMAENGWIWRTAKR